MDDPNVPTDAVGFSVSEEERIRLAYQKRTCDAFVYSYFNRGHLFGAQQVERALVESLEKHGMNPLSDKRILEVGCGTGGRLRQMINYGAKPGNLHGVDLLQGALEEARKTTPNIDFRVENAESLSFQDRSFDMVMQFTVFTSILNDASKQKMAEEMLRTLKASGVIVWYDYFVSKPSNPDVKRIGKREIMSLFRNCSFDFNKVTLAPPVARAVAPYSFLLCYLLEKIPFLRTHYLVIIKKKSSRT